MPDWAAVALLFGSLGTALGAMLKFILESKQSAANIEAKRLEREDANTQRIIDWQTAQIATLTAERDRLLASLMTTAADVNRYAAIIEQSKTQQATSSPTSSQGASP